jgi:hypothetical protein
VTLGLNFRSSMTSSEVASNRRATMALVTSHEYPLMYKWLLLWNLEVGWRSKRLPWLPEDGEDDRGERHSAKAINGVFVARLIGMVRSRMVRYGLPSRSPAAWSHLTA